MIDSTRLIIPLDKFCKGFPELNFREVYHFQTLGEPILVTDPTYLADVYNSKDDIATSLRDRGVFLMDFGGDVSGPIWWQYPYVLVPISNHLSLDDLLPPLGVTVLANEIGTDSGSFIFLPVTNDLPPTLQAEINEVVAKNNGALLRLPSGNWTVYYEQWDAPEGKPATFYRNIVMKLE